MARRKSGKERSEEILEEGLKLLHEEGHSRLTVGEIAKRTGVSEAAIYKHFDSKEEIIREMAEKVFSIDLVDSEELEFNSPENLISTLLEGLFSKLEKDPEATAILFHNELFSQYPGVERLFQEHRMEKKTKLKGLVQMGQKSGLFDEDVDPEIFAAMMAGSIRVTVMEWRDENFSSSLTDKSEELASHLSKVLDSE
jgi:AcrR family transcriptional regulator